MNFPISRFHVHPFALPLTGFACAVLLTAIARAESVPIGSYVELRVGVSDQHPYATSGADARRSGRSRARAPELPPTRVWNVRLPRRRLVPPAVLADGTLIVGSERGLDALDPATGASRWFAPIGEVWFTPSITPSGEVLAFAGAKLWLAQPADGAVHELTLPFAPVGEPLLLEAGTVVVAGSDGLVHAVGLDGTLLSAINPPTAERSSRWNATLAGDAFVSASASALALYALHEGSAQRVRLSDRIATGPVTGEGVIWILGQHGTLFIVAPDGSVRARAPLGQPVPADGPALGRDGGLRVGLRYGEIACFDASGKERFRRGLDGAPSAMLIDRDDTVLFMSARGTLYAIDREGELRFRLNTELRGAGRPILGADGTVYVVGRGGEIAAFR